MTGIYIHIPFCRQACHYCNFHFSTSLNLMGDFVDALCYEIKLKSSRPESKKIETIYFGGGTPSLLPQEMMQKVFDALKRNYDLTSVSEITIECNPEDINDEKCRQIIDFGFNRISLGIQSFHDEDLRYMNRCHNARMGIQSIEAIKNADITNYSIDLIYGSPTLSNEQWHKNIEIALNYNIPHISSYALTLEEGTALPLMIKKNKRKGISEALAKNQFSILRKKLLQNDYRHYEVSNFALSGFEAVHNANYWNGQKYIGFGPGAHSFNGVSRSWNVSNNIKYIKSISKAIIPEELEELSPIDHFNERVMTSLRTMKGLNIALLKNDFGNLVSNEFELELQNLVDEKKAFWKDTHLILTEKGLLLCDQISSNLFIV